MLGTCARQQQHRRILVNAYRHRAFRAKNLSTNVIAIECISAYLDITKRPAHKTHVNQSIIDIADGLEDFAHKGGSLRRYALNFAAHEPASKVEVMNRHIENQTAALRRVCIFRPRAERVATERLKSDGKPIWPLSINVLAF